MKTMVGFDVEVTSPQELLALAVACEFKFVAVCITQKGYPRQAKQFWVRSEVDWNLHRFDLESAIRRGEEVDLRPLRE